MTVATIIVIILGTIFSLIGLIFGIEIFMKSSRKLKLSSLFLIITIGILLIRDIGVFVGVTGAVNGLNNASFFNSYNIFVEQIYLVLIILITLSLFFMKKMINEVENSSKKFNK